MYYTGIWQWQSNDCYLAHHGILGQKWGRRNGPPYPLSAGAHSSAEKRLKSKNDGKLESWKAKETAKINSRYDKKISRTKNAEKRAALSAKKEREKKAVDKMRIEDVSNERVQKGKAIVKGLLKYGAIAGLRSVAMRGTQASMALGNVPLALIFSTINFAATIPQLHLIVKAVSRARTRRAETDDEARKRKRKERLVTAGIITADTLLSVLAEMLGTAYVGPRTIMRA